MVLIAQPLSIKARLQAGKCSSVILGRKLLIAGFCVALRLLYQVVLCSFGSGIADKNLVVAESFARL